MDFSKILVYQEIDKEVRKLEKEVERSEDYKRAVAARAAFQSARTAAQQSGADAEKLCARYEEIKSFFEENAERIDDVAKKVESGEIELSELYKIEDELEQLCIILREEDEDLGNLYKLIDEVAGRYTESYKAVVHNKKVFNDSSEAYSKLKEAKIREMLEPKQRLAAMEKEIEPEVMEMYQRLRKEKIVPAFVPLQDGTRCGYCRMELSTSKIAALTPGSTVECEQCRRYVYKDTKETKKGK